MEDTWSSKMDDEELARTPNRCVRVRDSSNQRHLAFRNITNNEVVCTTGKLNESVYFISIAALILSLVPESRQLFGIEPSIRSESGLTAEQTVGFSWDFFSSFGPAGTGNDQFISEKGSASESHCQQSGLCSTNELISNDCHSYHWHLTEPGK